MLTKKDNNIVNQSTLKLRMSSNFGKDQSIDNDLSAKKLLLLNDISDDSRVKDLRLSQEFKKENRKEKPLLSELPVKKQTVMSSQDW